LARPGLLVAPDAALLELGDLAVNLVYARGLEPHLGEDDLLWNVGHEASFCLELSSHADVDVHVRAKALDLALDDATTVAQGHYLRQHVPDVGGRSH
jgi:hypothetical protein